MAEKVLREAINIDPTAFEAWLVFLIQFSVSTFIFCFCFVCLFCISVSLLNRHSLVRDCLETLLVLKALKKSWTNLLVINSQSCHSPFVHKL